MNIDYMNYIKPELLVLIPALIFVGYCLKTSTAVADKLIPAVLAAVGIVLAALYVLATSPIGDLLRVFSVSATTSGYAGKWVAIGNACAAVLAARDAAVALSRTTSTQRATSVPAVVSAAGVLTRGRRHR